MRYYIIFGITLIAAIIIFFYNPYSDYLGVYRNNATIEYLEKEEGYEWILVPDNDNLTVNEINNNKWNISINKKGSTKIIASFINLENNDVKYKITYDFTNNGRKIFWLEGIGEGINDFLNPY